MDEQFNNGFTPDNNTQNPQDSFQANAFDQNPAPQANPFVQDAAPQQNPFVQNNAPQQGAFDQNGAPQQNPFTQNGTYQQPQNITVNVVNEKSTKASISLGLGITGLVLGCCGGGGLFSLIAVIFGILSMRNKEPKSGIAVAGIITGAIGLLLNLITAIAVLVPFFIGMTESASYY